MNGNSTSTYRCYTDTNYVINDSQMESKEPPLTINRQASTVMLQPVALLTLSLCLISLVSNVTSIAATALGPNRLTTHLKLVVSLGLSDILQVVSTVSHLLHRALHSPPSLQATPEQRLVYACVSTAHFALHTTAMVISLLNLLAMAIDHYVAIFHPLHYPMRLSQKKGSGLILTVWSVAFLVGCSVFLADTRRFKQVSTRLNYCEFVKLSDYQSEYVVFAVAVVTFLVIAVVYTSIYREVRCRYRHRKKTRAVNYTENRKALWTTLLIIGTFVVCWLPTCLLQISLLIQVRLNADQVRKRYSMFLRLNRYLNTLLLFNTLCDPIIYAVRLRQVQLGYRRLLPRLCGRRRRADPLSSGVRRVTRSATTTPVPLTTMQTDASSQKSYEQQAL